MAAKEKKETGTHISQNRWERKPLPLMMMTLYCYVLWMLLLLQRIDSNASAKWINTACNLHTVLVVLMPPLQRLCVGRSFFHFLFSPFVAAVCFLININIFAKAFVFSLFMCAVTRWARNFYLCRPNMCFHTLFCRAAFVRSFVSTQWVALVILNVVNRKIDSPFQRCFSLAVCVLFDRLQLSVNNEKWTHFRCRQILAYTFKMASHSNCFCSVVRLIHYFERRAHFSAVESSLIGICMVCVRNNFLLDKIYNGIGGAFVCIIFSLIEAEFQWHSMNKLIYFDENVKLLTRNQKK